MAAATNIMTITARVKAIFLPIKVLYQQLMSFALSAQLVAGKATKIDNTIF